MHFQGGERFGLTLGVGLGASSRSGSCGSVQSLWLALEFYMNVLQLLGARKVVRPIGDCRPQRSAASFGIPPFELKVSGLSSCGLECVAQRDEAARSWSLEGAWMCGLWDEARTRTPLEQ